MAACNTRLRRVLQLLCLLQLAGTVGVWGHGSYHDLLAALDRELMQKPDNAALYLKRAGLHVAHEDWQAALIDLEQVERLIPDTKETDLVRGQALVLAGRWQAAESALSFFIGSHPNDAGAHFERGRARSELKRLPGAAADYRRALVLMPQAVPERVIEASNAVAAHEGRAAALDIVRTGLTHRAKDPALLQHAVTLAEAAHDTATALACVDDLAQSGPRPEMWMAKKARLLAAAGQAAEAKAVWEALHRHLEALPTLERGSPVTSQLFMEAKQALGQTTPAPVIAPPRS